MTITSSRRGPRGNVLALVTELEQRPGEWVEVARYPADRRKSAWSRGSQTCIRYPQLDYAVQPEGTDVVLYLRHLPVVP